MRFLNAMAWFFLVWSIIAIIVPRIFIELERNPVVLIARETHYRQRVGYRMLIFVVSLLWLIFGG